MPAPGAIMAPAENPRYGTPSATLAAMALPQPCNPARYAGVSPPPTTTPSTRSKTAGSAGLPPRPSSRVISLAAVGAGGGACYYQRDEKRRVGGESGYLRGLRVYNKKK